MHSILINTLTFCIGNKEKDPSSSSHQVTTEKEKDRSCLTHHIATVRVTDHNYTTELDSSNIATNPQQFSFGHTMLSNCSANDSVYLPFN